MARTIIVLLALALGVLVLISVKARKDSSERQERFDTVMRQARSASVDSVPSDSLQAIHNQVADDAVDQYKIANRQGDAVQTCVAAGHASAALLQAKDEARYREWKEIERLACQRAGVR